MSANEFAAEGFVTPEGAYFCEDGLPHEDAAVMTDVILSAEYGGLRLSGDVGNWVTSAHSGDWISALPMFRKALHQIGSMFRRSERQVLSAAEWLFESYSGTNQALQTVQAMTVFEILFGQGEAKRGVTARLAEGCSKALAATPVERADIDGKFRKLYAARCNILHEGKRRLEDQSTLQQTRELAKDVIRERLGFIAVQP